MALTVIVYVPDDVVELVAIVRVEATGPVPVFTTRAVLENAVEIPRLGGALARRLIVPLKPFRAISVIAEVPLAPVLTDTDVGVAPAPKLGTGTTTVTLNLCMRGPIVPDTVTV